MLLALPPLYLKYFEDGYLLVPGFWTIFFFISALTLIVFVVVLTVQQKNNEMYAQAFLGATTFKLLACLIFVLIFIKKGRPEKLFFVADFMYLYFLNTVFEIYGLLRTLRNQNSK
ncbi:hypothetical protein MuYL_0956 [Mucilaginibacter xinganensis]|uniref:Uncharacterized protein n=2 Tax=Mucilaginibacter xinganensis TaxID=1234841 RepID=A0A223NSQ6_9SPHI|nr:hypothetical protein MuYL_0956 [Mucilaginibacter xinganensis]